MSDKQHRFWIIICFIISLSIIVLIMMGSKPTYTIENEDYTVMFEKLGCQLVIEAEHSTTIMDCQSTYEDEEQIYYYFETRTSLYAIIYEKELKEYEWKVLR